MTDPPQDVTTEAALRLLTKQRRRQILRRVADTPDGTTVDQLKDGLGRADTRNSAGTRTPGDRAIELHHVHLPMLQEANVIAYDADRGTVQRGRAFQDVLSLLEVIDGHREDASTALS